MARQQSSNDTLLGIFEKIDTMIDNSNELYEQSLIVLGEIKTVLEHKIHTELVKHTSLLSVIAKKLNAQVDTKSEQSKSGDSNISKEGVKGFADIIDKIIDLASTEGIDNIKVIAESLHLISQTAFTLGINLVKFNIIGKFAQKGAISFGDTVNILFKSITNDIGTAEEVETKSKAIEATKKITDGILLFGLSLILFIPISPLAMAGAGLFALTVNILFWSLTKMEVEKVETKANLLDSITKLASSILLFGVSLALYTVVAIPAMLGALLFGATINILLWTIGSSAEEEDKTTKGLDSILNLSKGILLFGLSLILFIPMSPFVMLGALLFRITTWILGESIEKLSSKETMGGLKSMALVSLGIILFGASIMLFTYMVGKDGFVGGMKNIMLLTLSIVGVGLAFYLVGQFDAKGNYIKKGAIAMILSMVPILMLTVSLLIFKKANFGWEDSAILAAVVTGVGLVMAGAGAISWLIIPGAAAMILASVPIILLTHSMNTFKSIKWTDEDTTLFTTSITSIINTVGDVFGEMGIKKMAKVLAGSIAFSNIGNMLTSLAKGMQSMANLTFTEYEIIGEGTDKAKLIPKSTIKLGKSDFENVGKNIESILSALAEPLANVGRLNRGEGLEGASGRSRLSIIFGGGYIQEGIKALMGLGSLLSDLADGIIKMGEMKFIKYKLIHGGTDKAKLVMEDYVELSETEMTNAKTNITNILSWLPEQLVNVGKQATEGEGLIWGSGYLEKGREVIAGIGGDIASIVDTIIKLAQGVIVTKEVKNGKLVDVSSTPFNDSHITAAGSKIDLILTTLFKSFVDLGQQIKEKDEDLLELTFEYIPKITTSFSEMVEAISSMTDIKDVDKNINIVISSIDKMFKIFDPSKNKNLKTSYSYLYSFKKQLVELAEISDPFESMTNSMEKIEKSMKLVKEHINAMELKKLTLTDSLMKSIAILSKNPEAIAKTLDSSIKEAFTELIKALKELMETQSPNRNISGINTTVQQIQSTPNNQVQPSQNKRNNEPSITADTIAEALSALILNVKLMNPEDIKT